MKIVELGAAYVWDCDHCGRENFVRAVAHELTPEEQALIHFEEGEGARWITRPEVVECPHCEAAFSTTAPY